MTVRAFLKSVAILAVLAGCETTAAYEAKLQLWVGRHVDELVRAWGPPNGTYTFRDGSRVIQFARERTVSVPGQTTLRPILAPATGGSGGSRTIYVEEHVSEPHLLAFSCETTFDVDAKGVIRAWRWRGNDCVARAR